jgi:hypothetical protein
MKSSPGVRNTLRLEFQFLFLNNSLSGLAFGGFFICRLFAVTVFVRNPTRTQALPLADANSAVGAEMNDAWADCS